MCKYSVKDNDSAITNLKSAGSKHTYVYPSMPHLNHTQPAAAAHAYLKHFCGLLGVIYRVNVHLILTACLALFMNNVNA